MRILVFGAHGMMGHMACRMLGRTHEVHGTVRGELASGDPLRRFLPEQRCVPFVDVLDMDTVIGAIDRVEPDAVLNCVGVVKQLAGASDPIVSIGANSLFPHRLAVACHAAGARMLHLGTDCVFSGRTGHYREDDLPDPVDLYGRSKLLGETDDTEGLTLRTSIVGRQLRGHTSLFEWVLSNRGKKVDGFARAVYSGLTTMALSEIIERVLVDHPRLAGVWHVASEPITKFALLGELDRRLGLDLDIARDESVVCDRSLDGSAFVERTGIATPSWDSMLDAFVADQPTYADLDSPVSAP